MTETITWNGMEIEMEGSFKPARPAPRCSNPDDPRFSDDGDPAEVEIIEAHFVDGSARIKLSADMLEQLQDSEEYIAEQLGLI